MAFRIQTVIPGLGVLENCIRISGRLFLEGACWYNPLWNYDLEAQ